MTPWSNALRTDLRAILLRQDRSFIPPAIAWQGRKFVPVPGQPWLRERLQPLGSNLRTVGARDGLISETFLYLLDIFWPRENELAGVDTMGDALQSRFRPGTHVGTAQGGYIQACDRAAMLEEPSWVQLPISARGFIYRPCD